MTQPPGPQGPYQPFPQDPSQGGQPHHGGYPHQGGYPQQPGQPQGYPQQGGYPQQQGFDPYGQQKKKSRLPWILAGVGVLVLGGGAVLLVVLLGGSGEGKGSTPRDTAEAFADGFNDRNADAIEALLCKADTDRIAKENEDLQQTAFKNVPEAARVAVDKVDTNGDKAVAHFKVTGAQTNSAPTGIPLKKNGDEWEVCFSNGGDAGSPEPTE